VDLEYIPVVGYMALLKKPGWGYELAERFGEDSDRVMRVLTMTRIQVEGVAERTVRSGIKTSSAKEG
tara:strand:+ start:604 stop:804 length:201 start_codon:yes stop_codon:yes gene_type:complete